MESLVVTLDTAKKLKAAGFPQATEFTWYCDEAADDTPVLNWTDLNRVVGGVGYTDAQYAAPTAQEIADQLPPQTSLISPDFSLRKRSGFGGYEARWQKTWAKADTMAEALAALWLKLQEAK